MAPASPPPTFGAALQAARQTLAKVSQTAGLDAQVLLARASGTDRGWLLAHPEAPLPPEQARELQISLDRCLAGEALAYVLGEWEFCGRIFHLTRDVLIPRPETELLVEAAGEFLRHRPWVHLAADVGTGSGCIAVTLLAEFPGISFLASDLSLGALRVAKKNAAAHRVGPRLRAVQMDLLAGTRDAFHLICANLPYVPSQDLGDLDVAKREPRLALDGGPDGLAHVRRILAGLPLWLAPGGRAILEIGADQGPAALSCIPITRPGLRARLHKDLAGHDRLVVIDRDAA